MMTDRMPRLNIDLWSGADRPRSVLAGQVWTLYKDESEEQRGAMVAVLEARNDVSLVTPLSHELSIATAIDPLLEKDEIPFSGKALAIIEMTMYVASQAFSIGTFLGRLNGPALLRLETAMAEYRKILKVRDALAQTEAEAGADGLSDLEIFSAFEAGLMKLIPPRASIIELAQARGRIGEVLAGHHEEALQIIQSSPGNSLSKDITFERVTAVEEPEGLYRTMDDLLASTPPAIDREEVRQEACRSSLRGILQGPDCLTPTEEVPYLRALIHARLRNWNVSEDFFQVLIGSNRSTEGMKALIWINHNQGSRDKAQRLAEQMAMDKTDMDKTGLARNMLEQAEQKDLAHFMEIESLDQEILSVWSRVES